MPVFCFVPPIALIRRRLILKRLREHGAVSPQTALTLREANVINPKLFGLVTLRMLRRGEIRETADHRYYLGNV